MDIVQKSEAERAREAIGRALYGDAYDEAKRTGSPTDFLLREYDKRIDSVLSAVKGILDWAPRPENPYSPSNGLRGGAFDAGIDASEKAIREALGLT